MIKFTLTIILTTICLGRITFAQQNVKSPARHAGAVDSLKNISLTGLSFRSIGPAITGGRIIDIAVNPSNTSEYFVASGNGSLWKTTNRGVTFTPAFEGQKSFSMGVVKIDPSNPNVVWVGTGEHNNHSLVIYGDGIYKSEDGGKSWKNMGLQNSEHVTGIVIDPTNSNIVYAAAYGSFRREGGDRGIYKTIDGGNSWKRILHVSEYTGFFELHMDPKRANILYASAHQRMRKGAATIGGGNESGIYRSTDSGETWQKVTKGLPGENVGRIGLAISPVNSDIVFALVQAKEGSGFYRSSDRGMSWVKQSSYNSTYQFYMQKIFADPVDENKIYAMDVLNQVSLDGGKTFKPLGEKFKHVDNHALWIDPANTKHLLSGCDGGVYESWDMGQNWNFSANIPITEIYKVSTDNASPFYNVYIGTQDNNSLMGPSRTNYSYGISNREWLFTLGGDGFETQADWKDENILYVQSQYGGLVRFDKKNGEQLFIQPVNPLDSGYRFDWDSPLVISKHNNSRLYFAANKVFRTNDRGNSWEVISPDLTRGVPQKFPRMMNRSWSNDDLASKGSLANVSAIAESPLDENIIYAGTADGLIHVTTNGGRNWTKAQSIPGSHDAMRIHHIIASRHNKQVAYATGHSVFTGDYKPYVYKTTDGGKTWSTIQSNLPSRGSAYSLAEDHIKPELLFVGTQFGLFTSVDGGKEWIRFMNGLPTTTVMDMEIHQRENDLVVSTFGRGVYIMDDYSPLRYLTSETLNKSAVIFPIKDAIMFVEANPMAFPGKGFQGGNFFAADNPAIGATFTYFIKDEVKTLKQRRIALEKEKQKKGDGIDYPSYDVLFKEAEEQEPYLLFVITDEQGNSIRKIKKPITKGVSRVTWDFRYQPVTPISFTPFDNSFAWNTPDVGYMVAPGTYKVSLQQYVNGTFTELVSPQTFKCVSINNTSLPAVDKAQLDAFNKKAADLSRAMNGADAYRNELADRLRYFKKAIVENGNLYSELNKSVIELERKLAQINRQMNGDPLRNKYEGAGPISLKARIDQIVGSLWNTTSAPTETYKASYEKVAENFEAILNSLRAVTDDVRKVEEVLEKSKFPYTPGRFPEWKRN